MPLLFSNQEMLRQLRRKLDEPVPSRFADRTLYQFLNESAETVLVHLGAANENLSITVPAGAPAVPLPFSTLLYVLSAVIRHPTNAVQPAELELHSLRYFRNRWPNAGTTTAPRGMPRHGAIAFLDSRHVIVLYPTPDQDYSLELFGVGVPAGVALPTIGGPGTGTDPTAEPQLMPDLRRIVVDLAYTYCLDRIGRVQEAELCRRRLDAEIADASYRYITQGIEEDLDRDYHWWDVTHI